MNYEHEERKTRKETLWTGTVLATLTWGRGKKPTVTYSTAPHTIPEEGSLDTVISEEDNTAAVKRITLL